MKVPAEFFTIIIILAYTTFSDTLFFFDNEIHANQQSAATIPASSECWRKTGMG